MTEMNRRVEEKSELAAMGRDWGLEQPRSGAAPHGTARNTHRDPKPHACTRSPAGQWPILTLARFTKHQHWGRQGLVLVHQLWKWWCPGSYCRNGEVLAPLLWDCGGAGPIKVGLSNMGFIAMVILMKTGGGILWPFLSFFFRCPSCIADGAAYLQSEFSLIPPISVDPNALLLPDILQILAVSQRKQICIFLSFQTNWCPVQAPQNLTVSRKYVLSLQQVSWSECCLHLYLPRWKVLVSPGPLKGGDIIH